MERAPSTAQAAIWQVGCSRKTIEIPAVKLIVRDAAMMTQR